MTKEEREDVIQYLENLRLIQSDNFMKDGISKAIEALKQQEPCEDCISREAVLAIAGDSCLDLDSYEDAKEFCDEIKDLPPVTPQEPFINKPCASEKACEHYKQMALDKIRAEIIELRSKQNVGVLECLDIIDKYREVR